MSRKTSLSALLTTALLLGAGLSARCQQVVERGAFGKPAQVLDDTQEWTTPLLLASDADVQLYIPDITNPAWLKRNYPSYHSRGVYTLSMFTFYKTPEACRTNQINWGLGDNQHLTECDSISYRMRVASINPGDKSATLLIAAMVDTKGEILPASVQTQKVFRYWSQLDANTQKALKKANDLVAEQMKLYERKLQNTR